VNIYSNDTVNGKRFQSKDVDVKILDNAGIDGLSVDKNGNMKFPPATYKGKKVIIYQICIAGTDICDTATVTVRIASAKKMKLPERLLDTGTPISAK
jgi:hypothetical protein